MIVGHANLIAAHRDQPIAQQFPRRLDWPVLDRVFDVVFDGVFHQAVATARVVPGTASAPRDLARAAAIRPENSGCGRVGRDRNSGWAWVATKNGWTSRGNSMNSTSRPSGDRPENTSPASSSCTR